MKNIFEKKFKYFYFEQFLPKHSTFSQQKIIQDGQFIGDSDNPLENRAF